MFNGYFVEYFHVFSDTSPANMPEIMPEIIVYIYQ